MQELNPNPAHRESDTLVHHAKPPSGSALRIVGVLCLFLVVVFLSWLLLMLSFFYDSTESWPGFVCLVPAALLGAIVSFATLRLQLRLSMVVSTLAMSFILVLLAMSVANHASSLVIFPRSRTDIAMGNWVVFASICIGLLSGVFAMFAKRHERKTPSHFVAVFLSCVHLILLAVWLYSLV